MTFAIVLLCLVEAWLVLRLLGGLAQLVVYGPSPALWQLRRRISRGPDAPVYMDRWQLFRSPWLDVYVNRINLPDADEFPHNHPWRRSWSLKLRGGYVERVFYSRPPSATIDPRSHGLGSIKRTPPRFSRIPRVHQIVSLANGRPCWTLFIGMGRAAAWGFVDPATGRQVRSGGSECTGARGQAMSAPTSLEALAAEFELLLAGKWPASSPTKAVERWLATIRAYLAARPASDLEQRLLEEAGRVLRCVECEPSVRVVLLEAADALTAQARTIAWQDESAKKAINDQDRTIAELGRELAGMRGNRDALEGRAEAAEARLADVAKAMQPGRRHVTEVLAAVRAALAAPAPAPAQTEDV